MRLKTFDSPAAVQSMTRVHPHRQRHPHRLVIPPKASRMILSPRTTRCTLKRRDVPLPLHSSRLSRIRATSAERKANERRWQESGNCDGHVDDWKWSLNWDEIEENIVVGSCPRSTEDIDRIVEETKATAILSVQSDLCLDAMQIDYPMLRERGLSHGVLMTRIPIRDFDHEDQSLMLPEAVKTLAMLLALNYHVYVHCTAGINRATLTVLGYLTFVQGEDLYSALEKLKKARPQSNPYIDCWKTVKTRLLEGRQEEVVNLSRKFFLNNKTGEDVDSFANWVAAEDLVIKETFRKFLSSSIGTISAMTDLKAEAICSICISPEEIDRANREIEDLKYELNLERMRLSEATQVLEAQRLEHKKHNEQPTFVKVNGSENSSPLESSVFAELRKTKSEVGELKNAIKKIAVATTQALTMVSMDSSDEGDSADSGSDGDVGVQTLTGDGEEMSDIESEL